jgi:tRNA (mo5U34)-methyltransferase
MKNKFNIYSDERRTEIINRMNSMKWYHKIDLGNGIVTPGRDYDKLWNSTRNVLNNIDYQNKSVLDIASWDGLWAFEAENRGAKQVIASDARFEGYENLLFAHGVLNSKVIPLCNVPVQDLENRLNIIGLEPAFDIVHHFGLLYHLRDPMLSLAQVRKVLKPDGVVILETAFIDDDENSYMAFSGLEGKHHFYGISDTWAPTKLCLREMIQRTFMEPVMEESWSVTHQLELEIHGKSVRLGRITMIAKAVETDTGHIVDARKVYGSQ